MSSGRRASLNAALAEIRQRWGSQAVQRLDKDTADAPPLTPTSKQPATRQPLAGT